MTDDQPTDIIVAEDDIDDVYIFELALKKIPVYALLRHAGMVKNYSASWRS
jgi:hypothetical protein